MLVDCVSFFFQAEDGIRDIGVTGVQTCALPIYHGRDRPGNIGADGGTLGASQALDHFPRSPLRSKKRRRDRLIRLAEGRTEWVVGFLDETWWSRMAKPVLHSWSEAGKPLRLIEQSVAKDDPDPKAISCYGLYLPELDQTWLRFVDGRPVSGVTTQFLEWSCEKLEEIGRAHV